MEKREQDLLQDEEKKQSRDEDLAKSLKNCLLIKDQLMTDCNNLQVNLLMYTLADFNLIKTFSCRLKLTCIAIS